MGRKHEFGQFQIKKTGGVAGSGVFLAVNDQINIPFLGVAPTNPDNISRPDMGNVSVFSTVECLGKKSPAVSVVACVKTSWFTHKLLNSLVLSFDAGKNSDVFALNCYDGTANRQYTETKCAGWSLMANATSGMTLFNASFICRHGDDEGTPASFSAAATDSGQIICASERSWNGTADRVRAWSISAMRNQIPDYTDDGTLYCRSIESKGFYGNLTLQYDPDSPTIPTNSATLRLGTTPNGVQLAMNLSRDVKAYPLDPSILGTETRMFSFFNNGSQNLTITSF